MTIDQQIKKFNSIAKDIQTVTEQLVKLHHQQVEISTAIYRDLEKPDCLFSESPISPNRITNSMRIYMSKLGWAWAYNASWAQIEVKEPKPFSQEMREAVEWARRFTKDSVDKIL